MLIVQLADLNHTTIDDSQLPASVLIEANQRFHQAIKQQRRKQFLLSRLLLANLLKQYCQLPVLPPIILGDNNRPKFSDANLPDFNISHSQNMVAVAINLHGQIGLDIELTRARENYLQIANAFFSRKENEWLHQQANPLDAFWQLWTLKESALKLSAKGVWQMKSVTINPETKTVTTPFATPCYYHYQQKGDVHLSVTSNHLIDSIICQLV